MLNSLSRTRRDRGLLLVSSILRESKTTPLKIPIVLLAGDTQTQRFLFPKFYFASNGIIWVFLFLDWRISKRSRVRL